MSSSPRLRSRAGTLSVQDPFSAGIGGGSSRSRSGTLSIDGAAAAGNTPGRSRAGSAVSARDVLDVLEGSAWGESIRRSFTTRKSEDGGGGAGAPPEGSPTR